LKMMPNSPMQKEIRKKIDHLNRLLNK